MEKSKSLEILKRALLMERKGYIFYKTVAEKTDNTDIKKIFNLMADEEQYHIRWLSDQFSNYIKNESFLQEDYKVKNEESIAKMVLSRDIRKQISAAGFEAAAISAAIDFETKAIEVYSQQAQEARDPNEKELYARLAEWEKTHYKILFDLDHDLKEIIWEDNHFWPF